MVMTGGWFIIGLATLLEIAILMEECEHKPSEGHLIYYCTTSPEMVVKIWNDSNHGLSWFICSL